MLVNLPTKAIAKHWSLFKEVLRKSLPTSPYVLPDRFQRLLYAALTGHLQCFFLVEDGEPHDIYCAFVTQISVDELTGERSLLIYALDMLKKTDHDMRMRDFAALKRLAKSWHCPYIAAYCASQVVANIALRANGGKGYVTPYLLLETEA